MSELEIYKGMAKKMKDDEIKKHKTKRIIEKIEGLATYVTIPRELAIYNVNIDSQEAKLLIDYITNLQQINNSLTTSLNKKIEEGINLQQENERLKKENEMLELNKVVNIANYVKDMTDYKSRCEKANEFINENTELEHDGDDYGYMEWINIINMDTMTFINNLSDILNGRSDE